MTVHIITYLLSFAGIWIGAGLAIKSVEKLSKTLKISSFIVSFLILGIFTSMGELSVGVNSLIADDPEIYVGNIIGASIVILMLIVPFLAIVGNSIRITAEFQGFNLPASLVVIALPVILVMDGEVSRLDSIICISMFLALLASIQTKTSIIEKLRSISPQSSVRVGKELLKILFGVAIIFTASRFVVEETLYFSDLLGVSPFLISLLVIAIGTNVPELSIAVRSAIMHDHHEVAFGDYVGSSAFNTFLLGLLTLIYGKPVFLTNSYSISLLFLIVGLIAFYFFARSKNTISRREGFVLLLVYVAFLVTEIVMHRVPLP